MHHISRLPVSRSVSNQSFRKRLTPRQRLAAAVEMLESRRLLAAVPPIVVNTTGDTIDADANVTSLREAILAANDAAGADTITFDLPGAGPHTIQLASELPRLRTELTIHGPTGESVTVRRGDNTGFYGIFTVTDSSTVVINNLGITNGNVAGGGVFVNDANLTMNNCSIFDNHGDLAGGLYNIASGTTSSTVTLYNCTISGNSADFNGGAIINLANNSHAVATVSLFNCTVADNTAPDAQIIAFNTDSGTTSSVILKNTLVKHSGTTANFLVDADSTIVSQGHNFSDDAAGGDGTAAAGGFLDAAGDIRNTDPKLDPAGLKNNGGPTATIALLGNSPAVNAGADPGGLTTDQRGFARTKGAATDIGAYELQNESLIVTTTADEDDGTSDPAYGTGTSLTEAINYANAHPGADTITLAKTTYKFTTADNNWYGPNALPAISSDITIEGNGATLTRDNTGTTTADGLRFFYVAGEFRDSSNVLKSLSLGTLTLKNLTLSNGLAKGGNSDRGGGGMGAGGAIFNQGNLSLSGVTLTGNQAIGGTSGVGLGLDAGGGIGQDGNGDLGGGFGGTFPATYGGNRGSNGGGGGFAADGSGASGGGMSGLGGAGKNNTGGGGDGGGANSATGFFGGKFGFGGNFGTQAAGGGGVGGGGGGAGGGGGFGGGGDRGSAGFAGGAGSSSSTHLGSGGGGLGGAIFSMYGTVTVVNSTLTANTARGGNGGTDGNGGSGYGGAIFNLDGTLNVTFSTIAFNTVAAGLGIRPGVNGSADGGEIYNLAYGNTYDTGAFVEANVVLTNSILAGTIGGTNDLVTREIDGTNANNNGNSASVTGTGKNIVVARSNAGFGANGDSLLNESTFLAGVTNANLELASTLADNGGLTQTLAPKSISPAIDAASDVAGITTDQRGVARPAGSADIGAVELSESLVVTTLSDENNGTSDPAVGNGTSLHEAIDYANAHPGADTITFALGAGAHTLQIFGPLPTLSDDMTITGTGMKLLKVNGLGTFGRFTIFTIDDGKNVTLSGMTISHGFSEDGGGGIKNLGDLTMTDCAVTDNLTEADGAGILNDGSLKMTDCDVSNNGDAEALLGGGISSSGTLSLTNCTVSNNTAFSGGGLEISGSASIVNSTIYGNSIANGTGSAIRFNSSDTLTLINSTITANHANGSSGLTFNDTNPGTVTAYNTIIAGNFINTTNAAANIQGTLQSVSANNMVGPGGSGGLTDGVKGNIVLASDADAKLDTLKDNGGPTLTVALLAGSPALNKGDDAKAIDPANNNAALAFDQRGTGFNRKVGTVDIGAFEAQNSAPVAVAGGPYGVGEGFNKQLNGGNSTDAEQDPSTLTYVWDLDNDGVFGETGANATRGNETGITPTFLAAGLDGESSYPVVLRVTDAGGLSNDSATTLAVHNLPPTASPIGGPASRNIGQAGTFTFGADDGSNADDAAGFLYSIDWGDGTTGSIPRTANNGSGKTANHTYANIGIYFITATATDKDSGQSLQVSKQVTVGGAQVITDPGDPTKTALLVGGTNGDDTIKIDPGPGSAKLKVTINNVLLGMFAFSGNLIVLGQEGNDTITVAGTIDRNSLLYGGTGNDKITVGNGTAIIIGGDGDDSGSAGNGNDILIGGKNKDILKGENGDDLLIAGWTAYDDYSAANVVSLGKLRTEWLANTYAARVNRLTGVTAGSAFVFKTSGAGQNVFDDTDADQLAGANGSDWFLLNRIAGTILDSSDRSGVEVATDLA